MSVISIIVNPSSEGFLLEEHYYRNRNMSDKKTERIVQRRGSYKRHRKGPGRLNDVEKTGTPEKVVPLAISYEELEETHKGVEYEIVHSGTEVEAPGIITAIRKDKKEELKKLINYKPNKKKRSQFPAGSEY